MYIHKLKIGNVELKNNVILAPMAGLTDKAFRIICKEYGAGLVCTEMASAKAIFYEDKKTRKLINIDGEEKPISIQIFGSEEEIMKKATKEITNIADIIDINMGCPAPKIVKNGDGSSLLQNLNKIENIVRTVKEASNVPVTVKIRTGWSKQNIVAVEVAKIIENAGADAIIIHGRTREEYYTGKANLEIIKKVKENVKIPVIGNGDIIDYETAINMIKKTGVDGIMIGRGALGNPWIFSEILEQKTPSKQQKLNTILKHIDLAIEDKGERIALTEMRKHLSAYVKNGKDASKIRDKINRIEEKQELVDCLIEYFETI